VAACGTRKPGRPPRACVAPSSVLLESLYQAASGQSDRPFCNTFPSRASILASLVPPSFCAIFSRPRPPTAHQTKTNLPHAIPRPLATIHRATAASCGEVKRSVPIYFFHRLIVSRAALTYSILTSAPLFSWQAWHSGHFWSRPPSPPAEPLRCLVERLSASSLRLTPASNETSSVLPEVAPV
jgi:hypothetical protein